MNGERTEETRLDTVEDEVDEEDEAVKGRPRSVEEEEDTPSEADAGEAEEDEEDEEDEDKGAVAAAREASKADRETSRVLVSAACEVRPLAEIEGRPVAAAATAVDKNRVMPTHHIP